MKVGTAPLPGMSNKMTDTDVDQVNFHHRKDELTLILQAGEDWQKNIRNMHYKDHVRKLEDIPR